MKIFNSTSTINELQFATEHFLQNCKNPNYVSFIYFSGGQNKAFFRNYKNDSKVKEVITKSILSGIWKLFSFIPSEQGLLILSENFDLADFKSIVDANSGHSYLYFCNIPGIQSDKVKCYFYKNKIEEFVENNVVAFSFVLDENQM